MSSALPTSPTSRPWVRWRIWAAYAAVGVGLWFVPLFNLLHVESAAVVAGVAYFVAGIAATHAFRRRARAGRAPALGYELRVQVAALVVPWALLTVTLPWVPNCGYAAGLLFYGLFPGITVVFATGIAYGVTATRSRRPVGWVVAIGLAVAALTPLYDLGLHPQFFVYNHVFGGVLGPIYDEELAIRPGLFAFRALTLLWAGAAILWGQRLRGRPAPWWLLAGVLALIGGAYAGAGWLGFNVYPWVLQRALGGHVATEHFDLYYHPATLDEAAAGRLALDHEYQYARLAAQLGREPEGRIASYLYPDGDAKARLVGARATNVAPVWLARPQTHVLLARYAGVFPHELAHVFARGFGLPVLKASWSVGLVEGFAVAMEPPDGTPAPDDLVAAAALLEAGTGGGPEAVQLAERVAATLSPLGFWTGRGAVSYTTMGSFVRYLIDAYGPGPFQQAYPKAAFEAAYGKPVAVLAAEWEAHLLAQPRVDREAAALVTRRFSVPSLFEKRCPHYVPPYRRAHRAAVEAWEAGDLAAAAAAARDALAEQPAYLPALTLWAQLRLADGDPDAVLARLDTLAAAQEPAAIGVLLGDAHALLGDVAAARAAYSRALRRLPAYAADTRAVVQLRRDAAGQPGLVEILVAALQPGGRAPRLLERTEPAARRLAAWYALQAADFRRAAAVLADTALWVGADASVQRRRQAWWAEALAGQGAPEAARETALRAAAAYAARGAFQQAAALETLADKQRWIMAARSGVGTARRAYPERPPAPQSTALAQDAVDTQGADPRGSGQEDAGAGRGV